MQPPLTKDMHVQQLMIFAELPVILKIPVRERPFHLKGGVGGLWFFSKKNILIPNVAEKIF